MNKRQYTATHQALTTTLGELRTIAADAVKRYERVDSDHKDEFGDLINALHDQVNTLEAQVRRLEIVGYGKRPQMSAETAALVAANID